MEVSRHWRIKQQRYAMVGEVCPHCQGKIFPPRDICPECGEDARTLYHFSGRGEVYTYSTVFQAPEGHEEQTPYTVALVRLEEGPMVTAQITDIEDGSDAIKIGMPVEMVTRKLRSDGERGTIIYGYKFRPVMREFAAS
jgi:uncharacterized OB-fold protein